MPAKKTRKKEKSRGRMSTGVPLLDNSLGGGLRIPSVVLVVGPPGSGKTALSVQFAAGGEHSFYIATNNYPDEIREIAKGMGLELKASFVDGYSWLVGKEGGVDLSDLTGFIETLDNVLSESRVERICFDSLSSLFMYNTDKQVEKFVQAMIALVKDKKACMLLVAEEGTFSEEMRSMLEFLTDGTIEMRNSKLFIKRMNGIKPRRVEFRFDVGPKGVELE